MAPKGPGILTPRDKDTPYQAGSIAFHSARKLRENMVLSCC